jgi:hypothetical protein
MLVLDLAVIVVSLVLEVVFGNQPEGGLLVVARTWRFARIAHGFYESTHDEHADSACGAIVRGSAPLAALARGVAAAGPLEALGRDEQARLLAGLGEANPAVILRLLLAAGGLAEHEEARKAHEKAHRLRGQARSGRSTGGDGGGGGVEGALTIACTVEPPIIDNA